MTNTSEQEVRRLWSFLVQQDPEVREALRAWKWRDKEENPKQFNRAWIEARREGVSVIRFLQAVKLCVIEDNKWTLANLMRYTRLRRANGLPLTSSEVDKLVEVTDEDLEGYDFGD